MLFLGLGCALPCGGITDFSNKDAGKQTREDRLKAALVYYIAKDTEWPPASQDQSSGLLVVCVAPDVSFFNQIFKDLRTKTVAGQKLLLRPFKKIEQLDDCEILVAQEFDPRTISLAKEKNILTVSAGEHANSETNIAISVTNNRLKLTVNKTSLKPGGHTFNHELLALADIRN